MSKTACLILMDKEMLENVKIQFFKKIQEKQNVSCAVLRTS